MAFRLHLLGLLDAPFIFLLDGKSAAAVAATATGTRGSSSTTAAATAKVAPDTDRVTSIPGYEGDICWDHYAGYLDGKDDHQLFYWYHSATSKSDDDDESR